jgi:hypothetical protein
MERGFAGLRGRRLDRAVALIIDALFDFELEAGVVRVIVARAADLENHTGVALITEGQDRSDAFRTLANMIAAWAMT